MKWIRLLDLGLVSPLRSQSIYHGLAYARSGDTPDTIVLATPDAPYVCIGFHQDLEHELDLAYCNERGLELLRRETGGGAVYLDRNQLFVQWVMAPGSLPARVEQRFELFTRPLVETYRELGIAAHFRPPNDVLVEDRKIVGTGAARIGKAEVLVGNFILDFDTSAMARILRTPSDEFRKLVDRSLQRYMSSMQRELGAAPEAAEVARLYVEKCASALGAELRPGALTPEELQTIEEVERRFEDPDFLFQPGGMRRAGVKIHEEVHVIETPDGPAGARVHRGRIEELSS
ncbi:MAG: ligase [Planctomycetes bacterium]|nr:ligase [Planctomycetota bacterium]